VRAAREFDQVGVRVAHDLSVPTYGGVVQP
jgi:hypothetical protein